MKGFLRSLLNPPSPIPLEVLLDSIKPVASVEPIARLSLPEFPSYQIDPIESAITSTAQAAKDADGLAVFILQKHLKELCILQLAKLSGAEVAADIYEEPK
ncbi:hypothetical protein [Pseudomonas sp. 'CRE Jenny 4']|uniref:hypothetical protein n=1 Tax=Pseudomonas sp. 'CRE Jenny 4' TaxID=3045817 RepID=UPI0025A2BEFD|nr:hypothetical protein [Pseudomonas sp. 'CRE Jenny 4']